MSCLFTQMPSTLSSSQVPAPVPRQKQHGHVAELPADDRIGGRAERRGHAQLFHVAQTVELVQATAADDSEYLCHHVGSRLPRHVRVSQLPLRAPQLGSRRARWCDFLDLLGVPRPLSAPVGARAARVDAAPLDEKAR